MTDTARLPLRALLHHLGGEAVPLATYEGRPILVVNTASQCGFTPQYDGLQALHEEYRTGGSS